MAIVQKQIKKLLHKIAAFQFIADTSVQLVRGCYCAAFQWNAARVGPRGGPLARVSRDRR